jgi:hypothetical protein
MSKDEIKHEINLVLDHFSDQALAELLTFLKQLELRDSNTFLSSIICKKFYQKINNF